MNVEAELERRRAAITAKRKTVITAIRLEADTREILEQLAEVNGTTLSGIIKRAIRFYLMAEVSSTSYWQVREYMQLLTEKVQELRFRLDEVEKSLRDYVDSKHENLSERLLALTKSVEGLQGEVSTLLSIGAEKMKSCRFNSGGRGLCKKLKVRMSRSVCLGCAYYRL